MNGMTNDDNASEINQFEANCSRQSSYRLFMTSNKQYDTPNRIISDSIT